MFVFQGTRSCLFFFVFPRRRSSPRFLLYSLAASLRALRSAWVNFAVEHEDRGSALLGRLPLFAAFLGSVGHLHVWQLASL